MKILLIHAHPNARSFVAAMRDVIISSFDKRGDTVIQSDLYAMNFNPVLSAGDFNERRDPDYLTVALEQRHGYETGTLAPDIQAEIEKVMAADMLVFSFPLFWFSVPAILKGWIDRVFVSGAFYGGRRVYGHGGLAGKRAFAVFGMGGREHMFGPASIHGELQTGMLRHFLQGSLGYVGLKVLEPYIAYHAPYVEPEARAKMLTELASVVASIDERNVMPMPLLKNFDRTFAPIKAE